MPITKVGDVSVDISAEGGHSKKREREKRPAHYGEEQYLRSDDRRGNGRHIIHVGVQTESLISAS